VPVLNVHPFNNIKHIVKINIMKIGVAIPCYIKHIPNLLILLDSIEAQTRKPEVVSISCSSTHYHQFPILKTYSFLIRVKLHLDKKSPAENRNIAADNLDTDIISFFDADDIMHPRRIELLEYAFLEPCDIVLHSFISEIESEKEFPIIDTINIKRNQLRQCKSGCIVLDYIATIAHGHVTVRKTIFNIVRFPEEVCYYFKEDCIFCHRVFDILDIKTAYLSHPLSRYIPSQSWYTIENNIHN
jgi:glycosyltransferase involved in cell wall biosynthesis